MGARVAWVQGGTGEAWVQGGAGEAWVLSVVQGGANEVCVCADAHGGAVPVSPEFQAERPLSSLGSCPAPEPEL
ncbi:hypothetical protein [Streptomyces sp. NPDC005303]|uniref:hypothetical protein n=1 Tax=Streptomyces sp. NPDC005303 TaxID=3155713 RepID=UPI00339DB88D